MSNLHGHDNDKVLTSSCKILFPIKIVYQGNIKQQLSIVVSQQEVRQIYKFKIKLRDI